MADNILTCTAEQVAVRWGTSARTIREMLRNGTLRGFKTGTRGKRAQWRVLVSELERCERESAIDNDKGAANE